MTVEHTVVNAGDTWYRIATRLSPAGITTAQRNTFAAKLANTNGYAGVGQTIYPGQVLHYRTEDVPAPPVAARTPKGVPFTAASPFNTKIPTNAQWDDYPILHTVDWGDGPYPMRWYAGETQLQIWRGTATDPVWTITMPDFGVPLSNWYQGIPRNGDPHTWNRWWPKATWTMHAPDNIAPSLGDGVWQDIILHILDETTGDYFESISTVHIDRAKRTITGEPNPDPSRATGWARGNVDTGTGVGGLLADGKTSAGVRASNFTWSAGAITAYDVAEVLAGRRDDFGHALAVMSRWFLSPWDVRSPATAPNPANNTGPMPNGARIGIPAGVPRPTSVTNPLGIAYWNTLQRYGAYLCDYSGGIWPIFQVDAGGVVNGTPIGDLLADVWMWWNDPRVTNPANVMGVYVPEHLRVLRP